MSSETETTIQFSGLKPGSYDYHFELDSSFFEAYKNEKLQNGKVVFDIKMEKKEHLLMFYFSFEGSVKTTCDRCLGEMEWPIEGEETLCVKFSDTETTEDENVVYLPEDAFKIDLAQWMYEYVAVALPIRYVHPDDENGEPTCDPEMLRYIEENSEEAATPTDGETDPRWDALKKLK